MRSLFGISVGLLMLIGSVYVPEEAWLKRLDFHLRHCFLSYWCLTGGGNGFRVIVPLK